MLGAPKFYGIEEASKPLSAWCTDPVCRKIYLVSIYYGTLFEEKKNKFIISVVKWKWISLVRASYCLFWSKQGYAGNIVLSTKCELPAGSSVTVLWVSLSNGQGICMRWYTPGSVQVGSHMDSWIHIVHYFLVLFTTKGTTSHTYSLHFRQAALVACHRLLWISQDGRG